MPTGPGAGKVFGAATNRCKAMGHKSFGAGSSGEECRRRIAEGIAQSNWGKHVLHKGGKKR